MNASERSIMMFLRAPMSVVTTSSSEPVSATSRSTSVCGITPSVWAPPARAPSATAPIMPTQPPPETRLWPRGPRDLPSWVARSSHCWSRVLEEAQKTQIAATSPGPVLGQGGVGVHDELHGLLHVVGQHDQVHVLRADLAVDEQPALDPVEQAAPVLRTDQDHREAGDLFGLHQRDRLEQLVERAEAAGQHDERLRVLDKHRLAHEEVPEID